MTALVMGSRGGGLMFSSPDRPIHDGGDGLGRRKPQSCEERAYFRNAWNEVGKEFQATIA
jgi:hypothetical protein